MCSLDNIASACITADSRHSIAYASLTLTGSCSPYFSYWKPKTHDSVRFPQFLKLAVSTMKVRTGLFMPKYTTTWRCNGSVQLILPLSRLMQILDGILSLTLCPPLLNRRPRTKPGDDVTLCVPCIILQCVDDQRDARLYRLYCVMQHTE